MNKIIEYNQRNWWNNLQCGDILLHRNISRKFTRIICPSMMSGILIMKIIER